MKKRLLPKSGLPAAQTGTDAINAPDIPERVGELVLYAAPDGTAVIQLRSAEGTVWLSQKEMAHLYQLSIPGIAQHLRGIFESGELEPASVIKEHLITATDRKNYRIKLYRLEAILAVGYRVRSHRGIQFRQWATEHLREFLVKGFVLDDARLKEGYPQGAEYFEELLARIRDIRSAEKVFYRKLRDIFALSADYVNQNREALHLFFQTVQNKLHWAASGKTAAEIVQGRADASKPDMGLTNWPGNRVRKADVVVAKSYLDAEELETLNRIVTMFLDQAEFRARRRQVVYMADWETWLDRFLRDQELPVLTHAGKVRSDVAMAHAESQYALFHARRLAVETEDAAAALEELEAGIAKGAGAKRPGDAAGSSA